MSKVSMNANSFTRLGPNWGYGRWCLPIRQQWEQTWNHITAKMTLKSQSYLPSGRLFVEVLLTRTFIYFPVFYHMQVCFYLHNHIVTMFHLVSFKSLISLITAIRVFNSKLKKNKFVFTFSFPKWSSQLTTNLLI